jgi:autotransporter-associated beta strand protein
LTKTGAGTLTLSAGYGYTGATKVLGGKLSLNSSLMLPSTGGDLTISNAVLTANTVNGSALPAANVTLNTGATLNLTNLNSGAIAINGTGNLLVETNTTWTLNYGTLGGNPSAAVVNVAGTISVTGTNNVFNITGTGFSVGEIPLIKYGSGSLASISGFNLGTLPPGVNGVLTNDTVNQMVALNITFIGQTLTWYGADGNGNVQTNWDINTSTNWNGGTAKYLEYNGNTFGDLVTFDDSLYGAQPTNYVVISTTLHPSQMTVNSSMPYRFVGTGSLTGSGALTLNSGNALFLETSNGITGGITVTAGSLVVTNDNALGAAGNGITIAGGTLQANDNISSLRSISFTANSSLGVVAAKGFQISGSLSGSGGVTKVDNGTLALTGSNSLAGSLSVNQGVLILSPSASNSYPAQLNVGTSAGLNGVMQITNGTVTASKGSAPSILVGGTAGSGSIQISGGNVMLANELWLATADGGYGALGIKGGSVYVGSWLAFGRGGGQGVLNMTAGTLTIGANNFTLGSLGGTTAYPFWHGVANVSGGTINVTNTAANQGNVYVGENTSGTLNMFGGALNIAGSSGLRLGHINTTLSAGIVNLLGGTVTTPTVSKGTGSGILNFNGGKVKASAANAAFISGLNAANIYANGATIDDGGFAIMINQSLLAPTGYGVSSIGISSGGTGYIDTPVVTISGGIGSNATAIATISGGVVTGITITSPGTGYDSADVLSATFSGGGGSGAAANTPVLAANVGGGLIKAGSGTLTLSGTNTYTGTTLVTNGSLYFTPNQQASIPVVVADGATVGVSMPTFTNGATLGNLTLGSTGGATLGFAFTGSGNPTNVALTAGTVTFNGGSSIRIAGAFNIGNFPLLKYSSLSLVPVLVAPRGMTAILSNDAVNSILYVQVTAVGGGVFWAGNTGVVPNLWDINVTTNWLTGVTPTTYQEAPAPGDAVVFNDSGSGTVLVSNTVSPLSVTISNTAAYAFSGSGVIAGSAGLTKSGSGGVTMSLANTYLGNTAISNGLFRLGVANAIPGGSGKGSVTVNGTVDMNTFSDTLNNLSGSGTVDTVAGGTPTLTLNSTADSTFSGVLTNSAGTLSLTKTGNGTLILSGGASGHGDLQINGGLLKITNRTVTVTSTQGNTKINNGGSLEVAAGGVVVITNGVNAWFPIGDSINTTNSVAINGGSMTVSNAWGTEVARIGYGVLTLNDGVYVNNDINVNGLIIGDQATAQGGTVNLNGGTLVVNKILSSHGVNTFNFNGGTLRPTSDSTNFFNSYSPLTAYVLAGGAIIDTTNFNVNITQTLNDGGAGGGLVKLGSGTLYLNGGNTYAGNTVVSNGVLAGIGSISSPVLVKAGGRIGGGNAGAAVGTLTLYSDLTLEGGATFRLKKNGGTPVSDLVTVSGIVHYGGTLVVTNITSDGTPLAAGDTFTLFGAGTHNGNFASIQSAGSSAAFSFTNGVLTVVSVGPDLSQNQLTNNVTGGGTTLSLSWSSGWKLQVQTNSLSVGLGSNWVTLTDGTTTSTNVPIVPSNPSVFYRLINH